MTNQFSPHAIPLPHGERGELGFEKNRLHFTVSPMKIGVQNNSNPYEDTGCARSLRSLRLPPVARLESTPMETGAGMT